MSSLVLELQRDALDASVSTSDLLRKALVVARKLKVDDMQEWIGHELNGYAKAAAVPDYRNLRGEVKAHNPYHGWVPLIFSDAEQSEMLSRRPTFQSVSELEDIVRGEGGTAYVKFPKSIENSLMKRMEVPMEPALILSKSQIKGLLDRVRNTVLDWSLGLEERGITGEGMSFSAEEQRQASGLTFNISHLGNLIGSMQDSQFQQGTSHSNQSYSKVLDLEAVARLMTEIRQQIGAAKLEPHEEAQLNADIACVEGQLAAPKPNVGIVKEGLRSIRSVLEGVASSALFQGVVTALGALA